MIRSIYDLENEGNYSVAGLISKNIKSIDGGILEINYCSSTQEDTNLFTTTNATRAFVDMKQLKGLNEFVNQILTKEEAKQFVAHYRELFGKSSEKGILRHVCNDTLINNTEYTKIYNKNFKCLQNGGASTSSSSSSSSSTILPSTPYNNIINNGQNLHFKIAENNPILNWNLCTMPKKYIMKEDKELQNLIKSFKTHYISNVDTISKIVSDLTYFDKTTNTLELKTLTDFQLNSVENQFKKYIITFYLQSVIDYKTILDYVKSHQNLNISNKDISN